MNKSTELRTTTEQVKYILERFPEARNSDDVLYLKVCERISSLCVNMSFKDVLTNRKAYNLPAFESVRRSRQKIQQHHPELAGDNNVEAQRELNEEVFREYVRN